MIYKVTLTKKQIFKAFQIDLRQYFKMRAMLLEHWSLQPSEYENKPFYEYQYYVKDLIDIIKEKNNENGGNKYNVGDTYDKMKSDASKYTKGFGNSMSRSGFGNIKPPKI